MPELSVGQNEGLLITARVISMDICGFEWTSIEFSGCWWIFLNRVDMCHGQVTWFLETHEKKCHHPHENTNETRNRVQDSGMTIPHLPRYMSHQWNPWRPWFDLGSNPTPNIEHHIASPKLSQWNVEIPYWPVVPEGVFHIGGEGIYGIYAFLGPFLGPHWPRRWMIWFQKWRLDVRWSGIAHNQIVFEYWRICLGFTFAWHFFR